jgi:hypothetical protein
MATNPVTPQLGRVLGFTTNIERNDTTFKAAFPYSQTPWSGTNAQMTPTSQRNSAGGLGLQPSIAVAQAYPNPFVGATTLHLDLKVASTLSIIVYDAMGRKVATVATDKAFKAGESEIQWRPGREIAPGQYIATVYSGSTVVHSVRIERQ